jgi:TetR/AcrR family transcriptional regulator, lmrAB and yxaGH operons repressor
MAPAGKHRHSILAAAARLFRQQGYAGTGLSDILEASGAPKGSLYHYFPGGKAEIGAAAVAYAGGLVTSSLAALADAHASPAALLRAYAAMLAEWMTQSGWRAGCPIATVLLETAPGEAAITAAGTAALASWRDVFTQALTASGVPAERASGLASMTIAAMEGALLLARVEQSADPILTTADEIARMLEGAAELG